MTRAATTILVFGVYLLASGAALILMPNLLLGLVGLGTTTEVWIRVLGVVVLVLGGYYVQAARHEDVSFFRSTVWGRPVVLVLFIALALLRLAPPMLVGFGIVDVLGAIWTARALKSPAE